MPDIKTALSKAISDWSKDDPADKAAPVSTTAVRQPPRNGRYFATTNNVTRTTFDYVKDHPGQTRKEIVNALAIQGYGASSVHSLLGQMVKQGLMTYVGDGKQLVCVHDTYTPLKAASKVAKAEPKSKSKSKSKSNPKSVAPPANQQINSAWSADVLLEHLSIKQAHALYLELKKVFGNN